MNEELQEMLSIYQEACKKMEELPAEEVFDGLMSTLAKTLDREGTARQLFIFLAMRYGATLGQRLEWATPKMQAIVRAMDVNVRITLASRFHDLDLAIEAMQEGRELLKDPVVEKFLRSRPHEDD